MRSTRVSYLSGWHQSHLWCLVLLSPLLAGCGEQPNRAESRSIAPASKDEVVHFCGGCHAYPEPETFPVERWRAEVAQGYRFYEDSRRSDLTVPDKEAVIAYYEQKAPDFLKTPLPDNSPPTSPVEFAEERLDRVDASTPAVSDITTVVQVNDVPTIAVSDMRMGQISRLSFRRSGMDVETIAEIPFPAHIDRCDLDGDGHEDWLISDLGSFEPADHDKGQLIWVQLTPQGKFREMTTLLSGVGRVADARAADLDQDGDQDVVVAVFGWRETGKLIWLEQLESDTDDLRFREHLLSERHGCSHIPLVDFDRDGDMDIVSLFSQEFELIELYRNDGEKKFVSSTIFQATDPSFGSSSIEIADLDQDGDYDILYTNGDSLDSHLIKPYHAVHWIETKRDETYQHHHLTDLPGAYCVQSADIDGDGDLDLVAGTATLNFQHPFYSLIWLEQTENVTFQRHNLEVSTRQHVCLQVGDFDADGDMDIATGHFEPRPVNRSSWLSIWWNTGPETPE